MTPLQLVGAGAVALTLGALAGFSSHYASEWLRATFRGRLQRSQVASCSAPSFAAATAAAVPAACSLQPHRRRGAPPCLPAGTAKQLAEDGIDPRSRIKFLPLAVGVALPRGSDVSRSAEGICLFAQLAIIVCSSARTLLLHAATLRWVAPPSPAGQGTSSKQRHVHRPGRAGSRWLAPGRNEVQLYCRGVQLAGCSGAGQAAAGTWA